MMSPLQMTILLWYYGHLDEYIHNGDSVIGSWPPLIGEIINEFYRCGLMGESSHEQISPLHMITPLGRQFIQSVLNTPVPTELVYADGSEAADLTEIAHWRQTQLQLQALNRRLEKCEGLAKSAMRAASLAGRAWMLAGDE